MSLGARGRSGGFPDTQYAPAVSTSDAQGDDAVVWIVGNDNRLYGLDGEFDPVLDGSKTNDAIPNISKYQTPVVWKGRIYVAGDYRLHASQRTELRPRRRRGRQTRSSRSRFSFSQAQARS